MALNPVAFTEQVVNDFLHYQLTTHPLADIDLYSQMKTLLHIEKTHSTHLKNAALSPFSQDSE